MRASLFWLPALWRGRLAIAARPRGGEWLEDDMADWRQAGAKVVVSLLTREEERELGLAGESRAAHAQGIKFVSFPIADRQIPASKTETRELVEKLDAKLSSGDDVVVHCRQGVGRSGVLAACLLINRGRDPEKALAELSSARGVAVPETAEQRRWIEDYATTLAAGRR